jgi:phosphoglycerate dehydrogenase-like enzyme
MIEYMKDAGRSIAVRASTEAKSQSVNMALVVVTHSYVQPGDPEVRVIEQAGHEVRFAHAPLGHIWTNEETVALGAGAAAIVAGPETYDEPVLSRLPGLRLLCKVGAGYDTVNVDDASRHGVAVCTGAGTNAGAVAEFAVTAMLALARHLLRFDRNVRNGVWQDRPAGAPVEGATVGVVGTGAIGRQTVRRVLGFDAKVVCYDIAPDRAWAAAQGATYVDLPDLLAQSDYVLVHAAKTDSSTGLIGRDAIALMKPTAYIVNTARGGIVDEDALYDALVSRRIAGAGIDVFETEPPADGSARFLALDSVVLSPHVAGGSENARRMMKDMVGRNVVAVLSGTKPYHCVNPQVLRDAAPARAAI